MLAQANHTELPRHFRAPLEAPKPFDRAVAVLSFDTEQIWGHMDIMDEHQFQSHFPGTFVAHERLLTCLLEAQISATWFVVGGLALDGSEGNHDFRMAELAPGWTARIPAGNEATRPLWYRRTFVQRLRDANPHQEIGLHGGLTHFIWTAPGAAPDVLARELDEGVAALEQAGVRVNSFSFPRDQEAHHELLPEHGIYCYRGRTQSLSFRLGRTLPGALLRVADELRFATPKPVWPRASLPGLWNIPSSLFLYPIGPARTCIVPLRTRIHRFRRGLDAAIRCQRMFHFCLHPDNLAECPEGLAMFREMLDYLVRARERGDVEVLTMSEIAGRCSLTLSADPNARL